MSNGYFVVYGEAGAVTTLLKLSQRDASIAVSEEILRLLQSFADLRDVLTTVSSASEVASFAAVRLVGHEARRLPAAVPGRDPLAEHERRGHLQSVAIREQVHQVELGAVGRVGVFFLCSSSFRVWAPSAVEAIALAVTETKFADSEYNKGDGVVFRMIDVGCRLCFLNLI